MHVAPAPTMRIARPSVRMISFASTERVALAGLILLGFALRLPLLDRFPFREDEAIYSVWALHALREDPLFLRVWPDKPPLFLWLLAGAFEMFGASQAAARIPNILVSVLTIPLVAVIARRLWGRRAALAAAVAMALNPFAISFAPTAFTDPLLVFAGACALWSAGNRRGLWAGVWLGVAIMTKQQGLFYAPLIVATLFAQSIAPTSAGRVARFGALGRFGVGLLFVTAPIVYWDSLRWQVAPSPWDLGVRNYGALALLPPDAWMERLQSWTELAWHLTASWPLWLALLVGVAASLFQLVALGGSPAEHRSLHSPTIRSHVLLLALWAAAFFAVHVITTVQVWDRYLLPLAPMVALGAGWLAAGWLAGGAAPQFGIWLLVAALLLLPPAATAAQGGLPIGGDHGDYRGLTEAFAWLQQRPTDSAVLYHRTLGWHAQFYLHQAIGRGDYELRWFPHALYLADNASKVPHRRKWLIQPEWAPVRDLDWRLDARGLALSEVGRFGRFTVFEITQPAQPICDWCVCSSGAPFLPLAKTGQAPMTQPRMGSTP
ncbi:MAG: glycosyltransferase family 39 protein [Caldilineaceae bacterium]|nr:glycosyltransferase family 39 protein [Caldilineaceae bacterium]